MLQKADQKVIFLWGQIQNLSPAIYAVFPLRYGQMTADEPVIFGGAAGFLEPAQYGAYPRHNFPEIKGLRNVIIGTGFQPVKLVLHISPGGQHNDRDFVLFGQHPTYIHTADIRQHPVQKYDIRGFFAGHGKSVAAGIGTLHQKSFFFKTVF